MVSSSATISTCFASKRCRAPEPPPPPPKKVILKVNRDDGCEDIYKMGPHVHLKKLMFAHCQRRMLDYKTVRFIYNGNLLKPRQTPAQLMMQDYDLIHIVMEEGSAAA